MSYGERCAPSNTWNSNICEIVEIPHFTAMATHSICKMIEIWMYYSSKQRQSQQLQWFPHMEGFLQVLKAIKKKVHCPIITQRDYWKLRNTTAHIILDVKSPHTSICNYAEAFMWTEGLGVRIFLFTHRCHRKVASPLNPSSASPSVGAWTCTYCRIILIIT